MNSSHKGGEIAEATGTGLSSSRARITWGTGARGVASTSSWPGEKGETGIVGRVRANRLHEHVSIEHLGVVENGMQDTSIRAVRDWAGALKNYTFQDVDGGTEVVIEMNVDEEAEVAVGADAATL